MDSWFMVYGYMYGCYEVNLVRPRENPDFLRKDKMVISVKIWNFSRSWMAKRTSPLESPREI